MLLKLIFICAIVYYADAHKNNKKQTEKRPAEPDGPVTRSQSGSFLGSWMETRRGKQFQAYRGIRYAEPPVGKLRFQPPKLIRQYKERVDASKEGPACPLPVPPTYCVDEDCLRINVYTPSNNVSKPLPVIFYIHAGAFYSMTGRSDLAGPHYLLDRDLVLVTINYRLGSLGFISTGDSLAPGNNGMKDQVAALRWVQRNIRAFGGDPDLVTIAGCSAGSISVMLHMISPMSKGLFHRGISMSGSPFAREPLPTEQKNLAIRQAEILDCPTNSSKAIMDCLMAKDWREIGDSLPKFFESGPGGPVGMWWPVVEVDAGQERFLSEQPLGVLRSGRAHTVPHIISQTKDEFFWKAPPVLQNETLLDELNNDWENIAPIYFSLPQENRTAAVRELRAQYLGDGPLRNDERSTRALGRLYGDSIIGFGVHRMVKLMSRHSEYPVYYYVFSYIGNNSYYVDPGTGKPAGAAHHDDTIYVLTQSYQFPTIQTDSPDSHVVDEMTAIWYNFARHGDPNNCGDTPEIGVRWPEYDPAKQQYLDVGDRLTVRKNYAEDRFQLWDELYPIQY
ncbi:integument esterase 1 precursor [Bombyx mori]|uniref:Carboxylic ester hydrolase n=1 Tax=Bombyx mori TaxID=7091 RepID=B0FGV8_BOMMO|nr:integument esterase 1 precursor [Bombyx mori]ABY57298.1 carboxylesterase CarE-7 [Bombyx mori]